MTDEELTQDEKLQRAFSDNVDDKVRRIKEEEEERRKALKDAIDEESPIYNATKRFHERMPFWFDPQGAWWVWQHKESMWRSVQAHDIAKMISGGSGVREDRIIKNRDDYVFAMKIVGSRFEPEKMPTSWIPYKGGILDLDTNQTYANLPRYFNLNTIPHKMGINGETFKIDTLFRQWVKESDVPMLYEIIAYCLVRDYPMHRIFALVGDGSNGKSTFLTILERFLGDHNCATTNLELLQENRFETWNTYGKLAIVMSETSADNIEKSYVLKSMSGGDLISYEAKHATPFQGRNYGKIIMASNNLPYSTDTSTGYYRRWMVIDFPNQFTDEKDVLANIPESEFEALLYRSVSTLKRILADRKMTNQGNYEERKTKYIEIANPLKGFIEKYCDVTDPDAKTPKSEFYIAYCKYLKLMRRRSPSPKMLYKFMTEEGIDSVKSRRTKLPGEHYDEHDAPIQQWIGIKLLPEQRRIIDSVPNVPDISYFPLISLYRETSEKYDISGISGTESLPSGYVFKPRDEVIRYLNWSRSNVNDGNTSTSYDAILALCKAFNADYQESDLDLLLAKMCEKGEIYESKPGLYHVLV